MATREIREKLLFISELILSKLCTGNTTGTKNLTEKERGAWRLEGTVRLSFLISHGAEITCVGLKTVGCKGFFNAAKNTRGYVFSLKLWLYI